MTDLPTRIENARPEDDDIDKLVGKLTKAQWAIVLRGYQATDRWSSVKALSNHGLLLIRPCFLDGEGIRLSSFGLAVRQRLEQEPTT